MPKSKMYSLRMSEKDKENLAIVASWMVRERSDAMRMILAQLAATISTTPGIQEIPIKRSPIDGKFGDIRDVYPWAKVGTYDQAEE